jgi:hypothetical protein
LEGKVRVSLQATDEPLSYERSDGVLKVSIPAELRGPLARQEAVVIRVSG